MGLLSLDHFGDEECRSFFKRVRVGHLAVSVRGLPTVVPVPYVLDDCGFLIGVSVEEVARAMCRNVTALQADGWDDDVGRRWTVLTVGIPVPATVEQEQPLLEQEFVPIPWHEPHVFRLQPHMLSGHWIT